MEITKGENANLAGMEPRCPKCGGTELTFKSGSDLVGWMGKIWCASCTGEWAYYDIEDWKDFAQFFRSPFLLEQISLLRRHIASPAQPEKRDEWVSVKMRLPEIHQTVIFCIDSEEDSQEIQAIVRKNFLGAVDNADYEDIKVRGYTHWRDLEVQPFRPPPQSGKEGQP